MPNPPKPTELKRRTGNPGKRRLPDRDTVITLPAADGIPDPLRPLEIEGRRMWDRVWGQGAVWLSPATDAEVVQMLAEAMDERVVLRALVMSGDHDWRDRIALRSLDDQIKSMLSILGFTPSDRAKMGVAEVKQVSKLDAMRARRAT
ncbi:MAG: hypothetical protein K9G24_05120 [Candidatus Nanopelagicales bacterium]|nr:hypothetical protein [Candidatus Nanopelagicales bacterium]